MEIAMVEARRHHDKPTHATGDQARHELTLPFSIVVDVAGKYAHLTSAGKVLYRAKNSGPEHIRDIRYQQPYGGRPPVAPAQVSCDLVGVIVERECRLAHPRHYLGRDSRVQVEDS